MNHYEQFLKAVDAGVTLNEFDAARIKHICDVIPGYSDAKHYAFFRTLVELRDVRDILILGVYRGRDIAFMRDNIVTRMRTSRVWITGVDKFSDDECADWPEWQKGKTWAEAGFGPAPSLEQTRHALGFHLLDGPRAEGGDYAENVTLVQMTDEAFLTTTEQKFDAVYCDCAHDYESVSRQIRLLDRVCRDDAIICGDDYSDLSNVPGGNWGVKRAVNEAFSTHTVFAEWIWITCKSKRKELRLY